MDPSLIAVGIAMIFTAIGVTAFWTWRRKPEAEVTSDMLWRRAQVELASMQNELTGWREWRHWVEAQFDEWRRGTRVLINQIVTLGHVPEWQPPAYVPPPAGPVQPVAISAVVSQEVIVDKLRTLFDLAELAVLAGDLGIQIDDIAGRDERLPAVALKLAEHMRKAERMGDLVAAVRKARPNAGV